MNYYLEDSASKAIILISDNIFLVNNISSGLLDNYLSTTVYSETASKIKEHLSKHTNVGIAFGKNSLEEVDLTDFEYTREKIRLIKLRKPLFEELLLNVHRYTASNRIGFNFGDEVYIQYALANKDALSEYATVMNISPEFAGKELKLISDSVIKNNFRMFTVASQLKEKINNVQTDIDATNVKTIISKSFHLAGMVNV